MTEENQTEDTRGRLGWCEDEKEAIKRDFG